MNNADQNMKTIKADEMMEKFHQLPYEMQAEVADFLDFIAEKNKKMKERDSNKGNQIKKERKFDFNWAGGIKDLKDKYSSVQLQKKALEWW